MKGFIIIILFSFSTLLGVAQTSWVGEDLPWMIERRSNGVRRISQFIPSDSVMGARKLVKTTCYDQHDYETSPLIELQYDTLGRLTRRLEKQHREIAGATLTDTVRIQHICYSPEGLVSLYSDVSLRIIGNSWYTSMIDTHIITYQLVGMNIQSGLGVTRCSYLRKQQWLPASYFGIERNDGANEPYNTESTCICERTFDQQGRLLTEVAEDCDEGVYSYARTYVYDHKGRIVQEYRSTYEDEDTLYYQYNSIGDLIGMDGIGYSEDMKIDIHIRCQSNGLPLEETTTWWNIEDEGDPDGYPQAILRTYYDQRGNVVKTIYPGEPVYEYDYEYW